MMRKDVINFREKCKHPYFEYDEVNTYSLFLVLVINNMAVEEENKLQNWCKVLRVVTKYCESKEKQQLLNDWLLSNNFLLLKWVSQYT